MNRSFYIAALAVAVAASMFWLSEQEEWVLSARQKTSQSEPTNLISPSSSVFPTQLKTPEAVPQGTTVHTPVGPDNPLFARSLSGTDLDGALTTDSFGNLLVDQSLRDFFDYFLSAHSEVGDAQAIAEIAYYIEQYLPATAAQQALQILEQYIQFKLDSIALMNTPLNTAAPLSTKEYARILRETYARLKVMRAQHFDSETERALFGDEDQYSEFTLKSMDIYSDYDLTDKEKQDKVNTLRQQLPSSMLEQETQLIRRHQRQEAIESILALNRDDVDTFEALVGAGTRPEQAQSILAYRQEQHHFEQQYLVYAGQRDVILAGDETSSVKTQSLHALRQQVFTKPENATKAKLLDLSSLKE